MSPNITINTPFSNAEVQIKSWITGREAEFIDELMYEAVAVKADIAGKADIGNVDLKKIIADTAHRKIETFVISVGDNTENILDTILSMNEDDYKFILDSIDEQRKKK